MNLCSKKTIKELFSKYEAKPLKRLGQNFLIDKGVVKKVVEAAELEPNDAVIEIGPGIGVLTQEIAKKVHLGKVMAIEKDPKMIEILKETLKEFNNIEIIQGDILNLQLLNSKLQITNSKQIQNSKFKIQNSFKIVANLPFYLTAPIIRKFLEMEKPPKEMVFVVQKEVAQRICSKPGQMSILAVSVQFYAETKIIKYISKKSFWPQPKVDSAIIKIVPRRFYVPVLCQFREQFFKIVKAGFSQPRKQLINNLAKQLKIDKIKIKDWLLQNKIEPSQRAETLTVEDWVNLTKTFIK